MSLFLFETFSIVGSIIRVPPPTAGGVSSLRTTSTLPGLSGITWKVSGSGLDASSAYAPGFAFACCAYATDLGTNCTDFTCGIPSSSRCTRVSSAAVAFVFM